MNTFREIENIGSDTYAYKAINALRVKCQAKLGDSGFLLLKLMNVVNFIMLHDKFASKGFYITDENREDEYIKIIETGDMNLIEQLEEYIAYMDRLKPLRDVVDEYNHLVDKIKDCGDYNDVETINDIIKDFIHK